jgi:hypothetical protein
LRRFRYTSTWSLWYVNANSDSIDSHTVKLMMIDVSSRGRTDVELPSSVWWRHTNPGDSSPSLFTRSISDTKSASSASSNGARNFARLYCAMCHVPAMPPV